uniref:Heat shock factor-binding protein 1 n=1 Tax=Neovison vison TaxID=452646 RepID=A0A8C7AZ02_NEOVI
VAATETGSHLLDLTLVMQTLPQQMQDKHRTMSNQIMRRIVGMSSPIDDLEENSENLVTQAGVEETEDEDKIPGTPKS